MKPYIFVDLDETLIHSYDIHEIPSVDAVNVDVHGQFFKTRLRPGAKDFLAQLREIGEVRMLTVATRDYALKMNETFGLGFLAGDIWSREHLQGGYTIDLEPADNVYLFDNLQLKQNRLKVNLLRGAAKNKTPSYIQVKEYIGTDHFPLDEEEIARLIKKLYESDGITKHASKGALDDSQRSTGHSTRTTSNPK
jgi:hypothetical protein